MRANMVQHPADYKWSSYRTNAQGELSGLISPHVIYERLGLDDSTGQSAYRELFRYQLEPKLVDEIRQATNGNYVLGNTEFVQQIEKALDKRVSPDKAGRPRVENAVN
jgi:putative transposase